MLRSVQHSVSSSPEVNKEFNQFCKKCRGKVQEYLKTQRTTWTREFIKAQNAANQDERYKLNENQVWIEDFHGKQAKKLEASAKKVKVPMEFEVKFQREFEQK